ncbi:MAG TPA: peptidylprolyl isomerase [Methanocorpusculum sp.]|nr:peptidylprolyl isomerase [Methanocorpusculum sp.]
MSVQNGNTIRVHYIGELLDGTRFDSSEGRDLLEFIVGSGMVVPGFDAAVLGMEIGETKSVTISPADAYGEKTDEMTVEIPRGEFGEGFTAEPGEQLMIQLGDGNQIPVTITKIDEDTVTLDANHPLAGKTLVFTITLAEILETNPDA